MRGYPERTLATRAKWLLDTRADVEVSATEWVEEVEAVLKELANAPAPEPVGEAVDFNGWRIVRWKEEESSFPLGTKFYTSPPANNQSEQHLEMVNAPAPSVPNKPARDEITRMAREAGFVGMDAQHGALSRFAALVAAAEREECARVCQDVAESSMYDGQQQYAAAACRDEILARGKKGQS